MLIFFAVSGTWQTLGWHWRDHGKITPVLVRLSTLHTGRGLKNGFNLSSPYMHWLVVAMAASLVLTITLGVIMAFRFGHKRIAAACLLSGVLVPLILALFALSR